MKPIYKITMSDENKDLLQVAYSDNIFKDASLIIEQSRSYAYRAVNVAMIQRNWLLDKRIPLKNWRVKAVLNMAKRWLWN